MNIDTIIEELRNEQFHLLSIRYNCIGKSFKLKQICRSKGVNIRVALALCLILNAKFWFLPSALPIIHGWAEIEGKRIELARPPGETNSLGTYDIDIIPLIGIWV